MRKQFLKDASVWGFTVWLIGYLLGIVLFMLVPYSMIGWYAAPIGTALTLWVLLKKIQTDSFLYYIFLGVVWVMIAVVLDYLLLVKLFKPADGYYKPDVYVYYTLTFLLPAFVGCFKQKKSSNK